MMEKVKKRNWGKIFFSVIVIGVLLAILAYVTIDLYRPFRIFIETDDIIPLQEQINKYGFWRYFFIVILHTFQVLLTIIPAQPIQIIAGLTCGPWLGFISCVIGIFLGNTIVYFLVRIFKTKPTLLYNSKQMEKLGELPEKKTKRRILSFYFSFIFRTSSSLWNGCLSCCK